MDCADVRQVPITPLKVSESNDIFTSTHSGVRGLTGELSGVLDKEDVREPSLDDWLETGHVVQGERSGTATVSGICGDLIVRSGGVVNDIESEGVISKGAITDGVGEVIIFDVDGVIKGTVDDVTFEIVENTNDVEDDMTVADVIIVGNELLVDDKKDGADDVIIDSVEADDVNIVIGDSKMAVEDSGDITFDDVNADNAVTDGVIAVDNVNVGVDESVDLAVNNVIVDDAGIVDVTSVNEDDDEAVEDIGDNETVTDDVVACRGDACVKDTFDIAVQEVDIGEPMRCIIVNSLLGFKSLVVVSWMSVSSLVAVSLDAVLSETDSSLFSGHKSSPFSNEKSVLFPS